MGVNMGFTAHGIELVIRYFSKSENQELRFEVESIFADINQSGVVYYKIRQKGIRRLRNISYEGIREITIDGNPVNIDEFLKLVDGRMDVSETAIIVGDNPPKDKEVDMWVYTAIDQANEKILELQQQVEELKRGEKGSKKGGKKAVRVGKIIDETDTDTPETPTIDTVPTSPTVTSKDAPQTVKKIKGCLYKGLFYTGIFAILFILLCIVILIIAPSG